QAPSVGAEIQRGDRAEVLTGESDQRRIALSFQIPPLPVAASRRAFVEKLFDPGNIAGQPFAAGKGDVAQVELVLGLTSGFNLVAPRPIGDTVGLCLSPPRRLN